MLRRATNCINQRILLQIRQQSTISDKKKWDLLVGVQIERLPILTKTLTKIERDYQVNIFEKTQYKNQNNQHRI